MVDPGARFVVAVAILADGTATEVDTLVNDLISQLKIEQRSLSDTPWRRGGRPVS